MSLFYTFLFSMVLFCGGLQGSSGVRNIEQGEGRNSLRTTCHGDGNDVVQVCDDLVRNSSNCENFSGKYEVVYQTVKYKLLSPGPSDTEGTSEEDLEDSTCTLILTETEDGDYTLSEFDMQMQSESYKNLQRYMGKKIEVNGAWGDAEQRLALFVTGKLPNKEHTLKPIMDHPDLSKEKEHFGLRYNRPPAKV